MTLSTFINQEMESNFKMIRTSISRIEGEFWKEDEKDWVYGYILFHVMEAIEFYISNSADEWIPMTEITSNSRKVETKKLQNKDRAFFEDYLSKLESKTFEVLNNFKDDQLLENDGFSPRGFTSRLHKFSYVIRHSMYHIGELTKTLRDNDRERIKWA